jgi:hypothetical protein
MTRKKVVAQALIDMELKFDGFVKSLKIPFPVIPAKAGHVVTRSDTK